MTSQTYQAFGLGLNSNFSLPFLPRTKAAADIIIRYAGQIEPLADPPPFPQVCWQQEGPEWVWDYRETDGHLLRFRFQGSGNYLNIYYSQAEMADIFPCLMGPGLGAALHLRGVPLLHGAAAVLNGNALVVSGNSGMGKSTLTAALVAAGLPLLTEELTTLDFMGNDFWVLPGYPGLQLHADAVQGLGYSLVDCPPVYPGYPSDDKRWLDVRRLPGGFHPDPAPLGLIYLLSGRQADLTTPKVTPLSRTQACLALLEHLYGRRWLNLAPQEALTRCARLAERVQVRRVWTPEGLDAVAATAQALMRDAQANGASGKSTQRGTSRFDG